jgi:hypothetical protein
MQGLKTIVAGGIGLAALAAAAPAAAQYYPGYGNVGGYAYGNPYGGNVGGYGYGANSQVAVNQCTAAVQARLGGSGYGYNGYGYGGGGRVLGVSRIEPRSNGVLVRGVASSGRYGNYAYGAQSQVDLTWRCRFDFRGFVSDVSIQRAQPNYGYGYNGSPYDNDYSQYGYRRY